MLKSKHDGSDSMLNTLKYVLCAVLVIFGNSAHAKFKIENAFLLSPNMTKKEVFETMGGKPTASEFTGDLEEWHYCKSRYGNNPSYEFVSVFFVSGSVIAMKQYGVVGHGISCNSGIKGGSYREPDVVKEYRLKLR